MANRTVKSPLNFKVLPQTDVPHRRNGKHKAIITKILSDLDQLPEGVAMKVPLADLPHSKEKIRSALNRATRMRAGGVVATASDETYLYVWNESDKD